jgi:AcrR family transcriptional regulator
MANTPRIADEVAEQAIRDIALGLPDVTVAASCGLSLPALRRYIATDEVQQRLEAERERVRLATSTAAMRELLHLDTAVERVLRAVRDDSDPRGLDAAWKMIERHIPASVTPKTHVTHAVDVNLQAQVNHGLELVREVIQLRQSQPPLPITDDPHILRGEAALPTAAIASPSEPE